MFGRRISNEELLKRLQPPKGRIKMVLDKDTYNEIDDQFALCYAMLSKEKLDVLAVYAAPFHNNRSKGPKDGMEKSYNEILRLFRYMNYQTDGMVFRGSESYLKDEKTPVPSEAVDDLISKAMSMPQGELLYVVAIGAITNVASAILTCPEIIDKIVIVWLGGQPYYWNDNYEFNLQQDVPASRVLFDCGVPVVQMPCAGVTSHLLTTKYELEAKLAGKNKLCNALVELFNDYMHGSGHAKEIWDIVTIAYLINPDWISTSLIHSPISTDQHTWSMDRRRHFIRQAWKVDRNAIFDDLFKKLTYKE